jgi:hypothetical protein
VVEHGSLRDTAQGGTQLLIGGSILEPDAGHSSGRDPSYAGIRKCLRAGHGLRRDRAKKNRGALRQMREKRKTTGEGRGESLARESPEDIEEKHNRRRQEERDLEYKNSLKEKGGARRREMRSTRIL